MSAMQGCRKVCFPSYPGPAPGCVRPPVPAMAGMCTGRGQSSPYPRHLAFAVLNWEMEHHPRTSQHCNSIRQQSPPGCTQRCLQFILPSHPSPLIFPACCTADRLQGFGTQGQGWDVQLQPQHLIQSHNQSWCLCLPFIQRDSSESSHTGKGRVTSSGQEGNGKQLELPLFLCQTKVHWQHFTFEQKRTTLSSARLSLSAQLRSFPSQPHPLQSRDVASWVFPYLDFVATQDDSTQLKPPHPH